MGAPDEDAPDVDADGGAPPRSEGLLPTHDPAPPRLRMISNPVIQIRNTNRKMNPTR
jgi:hypothetical protein